MTDLNNKDASNQPPLLPAKKILTDAFQYILIERRNFFAMAFLPVAAMSIFGTVILHFYPLIITPEVLSSGVGALSTPEGVGGTAKSISLSVIPILLVNMIFYVMFAVAWHRKWLLGESEITIYSALKWDRIKTRFLLRLIQIFLCAFAMVCALNLGLSLLPGTTGFMTSPFGMFLAIICLTLVFARLSILLPGAAIGDPISLKECLHLTNGNGWRLGVLVILPSLPITFVQLFTNIFLHNIFEAIGMDQGLSSALILHLFEHGLNYVGIAVSVSALSMAYKAIKFPKP